MEKGFLHRTRGRQVPSKAPYVSEDVRLMGPSQVLLLRVALGRLGLCPLVLPLQATSTSGQAAGHF